MPFITEKLWQNLPEDMREFPSIMYAPWPVVQKELIDPKLEESFEIMSDFVREIRSVKHDFGIPLKTDVPLQIETESNKELFDLCRTEFLTMANIDEKNFDIAGKIEPPEQAARLVIHGMSAYVPLAGMIDMEKEGIRIQKAIDKAQKMVDKIHKKLNSDFAKRAPAKLVEEEKTKLEEYSQKIQHLEEQLQIFN